MSKHIEIIKEGTYCAEAICLEHDYNHFENNQDKIGELKKEVIRHVYKTGHKVQWITHKRSIIKRAEGKNIEKVHKGLTGKI